MTDKLQENINNSYLLGCVKYKRDFSFYLMPVAYWILNHHKYNPSYNPSNWEFVFRDNVLNVGDQDIEAFIKSIEVDKINLDSITCKQYSLGDIFLFFIDFDSKLFASYFSDIEIEEYLPNEKWIGKFDNPLNYLPKKLKEYFLSSPRSLS